MNIFPTTQIYTNYNNHNTNFRANGRKIVSMDSFELSYRTYTKFFRSDLDWKKLVQFIEKKYAKISNINIINHACSNGSEPISLLLSLLVHTNITPEKFGKIMAYDYDKDNICLAKANYMDASSEDIYTTGKKLNCQTTDFFDIVIPVEETLVDNNFPFEAACKGRTGSLKYVKFLRAKPEIHNMVEFNTGNIMEDIDNMPDKNTVLMCRNFWPYLSVEQRQQLAYKISKKFDNSSLVVIGVFDKEVYVDKLLESYGFIETKVKNVFVKANFFEKFCQKIKTKFTY